MVLGTVMLDLDGAQKGGNTPGGLPVKLIHKSIQEPGAIGITTARRILDSPRLSSGDYIVMVLGVDR